MTSEVIEDLIFMARVAEQASEFSHMFVFLNELVLEKKADFTTEERNLLSVAFKNCIADERKAIKLVNDIS